MRSHARRGHAAVHVRHLNVKDRHVGVEVEKRLVGLRTVIGGAGGMAKDFEEADEGVGGIAIVVRDEDAAFGGHVAGTRLGLALSGKSRAAPLTSEWGARAAIGAVNGIADC